MGEQMGIAQNKTKTEETQKEPSMEEILSSIRRIISDDKVAPPEEQEEEDVLVLTDDMVQSKSLATAPANNKPNGVSSFAMPILSDEDVPGTPFIPGSAKKEKNMEKAPSFKAAPEEENSPSSPMESEAEIDEEESPALISPKVQQGSLAALAQLQKAAKPQVMARPQIMQTGLMVETLVRSAVEPMLKDWLEEHLQAIVEQKVQHEIERLAKKAELGG